MTRTMIAIAVASCLQAAMASAQGTHFTVSEPSASVYKAPTNVSPVIGHASQGATFEVTRDVGSWVKVEWSKSPGGVGYIRKAAGTMSTLGPAVPATPAAKTASASPAAPSQPAAAAAPAQRAAAAQTSPVARSKPSAVPAGYVAPTHTIGLGGEIGGAAMGGGFSARGWAPKQRFGVQLDVMRYSVSNEAFPARMSSTSFGPRVLYAFSDHVSDQTWVRPYAGLGAHVLKSSMNDPFTGVVMSDTGLATQLFGGTELTLSAVPRLGLSAEVGYQWFKTPFAGYNLDGMTFGVAAHWYVK